jgi:two-component system C4-dicarboxylate transport response regulator DctD
MHFDAERLLSMPPGSGRLREELEKVERAVIEAALKECKGEINATWQALGISRRALYERMKKYGLDRDSFR